MIVFLNKYKWEEGTPIYTRISVITIVDLQPNLMAEIDEKSLEYKSTFPILLRKNTLKCSQEYRRVLKKGP